MLSEFLKYADSGTKKSKLPCITYSNNSKSWSRCLLKHVEWNSYFLGQLRFPFDFRVNDYSSFFEWDNFSLFVVKLSIFWFFLFLNVFLEILWFYVIPFFTEWWTSVSHLLLFLRVVLSLRKLLSLLTRYITFSEPWLTRLWVELEMFLILWGLDIICFSLEGKKFKGESNEVAIWCFSIQKLEIRSK